MDRGIKKTAQEPLPEKIEAANDCFNSLLSQFISEGHENKYVVVWYNGRYEIGGDSDKLYDAHEKDIDKGNAILKPVLTPIESHQLSLLKVPRKLP